VEVTDNAMVDFADEFRGLTGISSYNFATLEREDVLVGQIDYDFEVGLL